MAAFAWRKMTEPRRFFAASGMVVRDRGGRILFVREADPCVYDELNLPGGTWASLDRRCPVWTHVRNGWPVRRAQAHFNSGLHRAVGSAHLCWRHYARANGSPTVSGSAARW